MDTQDPILDPFSEAEPKPAGGRTLYLIDGSGYIFRAFHALPPLPRADGVQINAVLGFTNMLVKLLQDVGADRLAVIFDAGRTNFRNDLYPEYKANRGETPPELIPQFPLVREATRAFNVPAIELDQYEADDLIASYAKAAAAQGDRVIIVSSDKDLMQLVSENVTMLDPIKNRPIGPAEVFEKFGVSPDKVVDVQALCGDSTDNVPGVRGIGVKTAAELITTYGSLDALLERAHEIKQPKRRESLIAGADAARLSRELVKLKDDIALPVAIDDLAKHKYDSETVRAFLTSQGFRTLLGRLENDFKTKAAQAAEAAEPGPAPRVTAVAMKPRAYALVQDLAALDSWLAAANAAGVLALACQMADEEIVGVALAVGEGEACYIPLGHAAAASVELDLAGTAAPPQIPIAAALGRLRPLLADPALLKIGHDIKRDMHALHRHGIAIAPVDDTSLISFVLEGGLHGHDLDELTSLHFGHEMKRLKDIAGSGKARLGLAQLPPAEILDYAAEQADMALRLHRCLKPRLAQDHMVTVYERIERPLIGIVAEMERAGIKVDRAGLNRLSADFTQKLAGLEHEIHRLAGHEFNIGSPKQLGQVLFEEQNLPGMRRTKTGDYSTDSGVLEPLAEEGYELPARVLDWRQIAKLKSTYADSLVLQINPDTGRVHTSFALTGAATGRLSSTDPNLQNIPVRTEEGRKIRATFIAEEGTKLLSVDYSQIELRLLAEMAEMEVLKEAFRAGIDIHALTASQVFGVPLESMDRETRRKAKAINFGIIYGISPFGLANNIGTDQATAKSFIAAYFERYPGIRAYMDKQREFARQHGFVKTLFGRKVHIQGIADRNPARRGFAERQAINAPLQGSAADIIKRAMRRIPGALGAAGLTGRMLLQVHDELLFEVPEAELAATSALVIAVMQGAASLSLPLVAEAGIGASWAEAH
jgi:DNA polymerase-1